MARYSTIKVDNETYAKLLKYRLKAQSRLGQDLSLTEMIRLLTELAEKSSVRELSQKDFEEALGKLCSGMKDIETKEVMEVRKALGVIDEEACLRF